MTIHSRTGTESNDYSRSERQSNYLVGQACESNSGQEHTSCRVMLPEQAAILYAASIVHFRLLSCRPSSRSSGEIHSANEAKYTGPTSILRPQDEPTSTTASTSGISWLAGSTTHIQGAFKVKYEK